MIIFQSFRHFFKNLLVIIKYYFFETEILIRKRQNIWRMFVDLSRESNRDN